MVRWILYIFWCVLEEITISSKLCRVVSTIVFSLIDSSLHFSLHSQNITRNRTIWISYTEILHMVMFGVCAHFIIVTILAIGSRTSIPTANSEIEWCCVFHLFCSVHPKSNSVTEFKFSGCTGEEKKTVRST